MLRPDKVRVLQEHEHGRHGAVDAHQAVEVVHGEPVWGGEEEELVREALQCTFTHSSICTTTDNIVQILKEENLLNVNLQEAATKGS